MSLTTQKHFEFLQRSQRAKLADRINSSRTLFLPTPALIEDRRSLIAEQWLRLPAQERLRAMLAALESEDVAAIECVVDAVHHEILSSAPVVTYADSVNAGIIWRLVEKIGNTEADYTPHIVDLLYHIIASTKDCQVFYDLGIVPSLSRLALATSDPGTLYNTLGTIHCLSFHVQELRQQLLANGFASQIVQQKFGLFRTNSRLVSVTLGLFEEEFSQLTKQNLNDHVQEVQFACNFLAAVLGSNASSFTVGFDGGLNSFLNICYYFSQAEPTTHLLLSTSNVPRKLCQLLFNSAYRKRVVPCISDLVSICENPDVAAYFMGDDEVDILVSFLQATKLPDDSKADYLQMLSLLAVHKPMARRLLAKEDLVAQVEWTLEDTGSKAQKEAIYLAWHLLLGLTADLFDLFFETQLFHKIFAVAPSAMPEGVRNIIVHGLEVFVDHLFLEMPDRVRFFREDFLIRDLPDKLQYNLESLSLPNQERIERVLTRLECD